MKFYTLLQIGEFHTNHCEDFLVVEPISREETLIAVLDGCTMGKESYFASALYGKILRKIARKMYYSDFIGGEKSESLSLKNILSELMNDAKITRNVLGLDKEEMLSTLVLGIINQEKNNAQFITVGDGLINIDGKITEYEQNNTPDYLGYHLGENFENWFESQNQMLMVDNFKKLSISTDGIFTFQNNSETGKTINSDEIISYLMENEDYSENPKMMERKMRILREEENLTVTDDLAIIRVIN